MHGIAPNGRDAGSTDIEGDELFSNVRFVMCGRRLIGKNFFWIAAKYTKPVAIAT